MQIRFRVHACRLDNVESVLPRPEDKLRTGPNFPNIKSAFEVCIDLQCRTHTKADWSSQVQTTRIGSTAERPTD